MDIFPTALTFVLIVDSEALFCFIRSVWPTKDTNLCSAEKLLAPTPLQGEADNGRAMDLFLSMKIHTITRAELFREMWEEKHRTVL